jgi:hypothetical protein
MTWLDNPEFILLCLILSVLRIYLEVINFNFAKLPLTSKLPVEYQNKVHKYGFYLSLLYFITFSPTFIFS